jgi:hypothetical protein
LNLSYFLADENTVILSTWPNWVVFNSIFSPRTETLMSPKRSVYFECPTLPLNISNYLSKDTEMPEDLILKACHNRCKSSLEKES